MCSFYHENIKLKYSWNTTKEYKHRKLVTIIMDQIREYRIEAAMECDTRGVEYWRNTLEGGKEVDVMVHRVFERGVFTVNLTQAEKECIEKNDKIDLFAYGACCEEVWCGDFMKVDIHNSENYTADEKEEISTLMWCDQDGDEYDDYDDERMDENGWTLVETKYSIINGCVVSENVGESE